MNYSKQQLAVHRPEDYYSFCPFFKFGFNKNDISIALKVLMKLAGEMFIAPYRYRQYQGKWKVHKIDRYALYLGASIGIYKSSI